MSKPARSNIPPFETNAFCISTTTIAVRVRSMSSGSGRARNVTMTVLPNGRNRHTKCPVCALPLVGQLHDPIAVGELAAEHRVLQLHLEDARIGNAAVGRQRAAEHGGADWQGVA